MCESRLPQLTEEALTIGAERTLTALERRAGKNHVDTVMAELEDLPHRTVYGEADEEARDRTVGALLSLLTKSRGFDLQHALEVCALPQVRECSSYKEWTAASGVIAQQVGLEADLAMWRLATFQAADGHTGEVTAHGVAVMFELLAQKLSGEARLLALTAARVLRDHPTCHNSVPLGLLCGVGKKLEMT